LRNIRSNIIFIISGVYSEEARELCRVLVQAGCSQKLIGSVIEEVLASAGVNIVGPTMSERTVARAVLEGGIMADIQLGHEISQADGLTVSGDGTTHKNVNYESKHINMLVPLYNSDHPTASEHRSRLVGVDSATDHSSKTQADGWKSKIQEKLAVYNQSPLAKRSQAALTLADFFVHLHGMNSDHAKDQKKLAKLLQEIKQSLLHEKLGEERLLDMDLSELKGLLEQANNQKLKDVGGQSNWDALSDTERLQKDSNMMSAVVLKLGQEVYSQLPDEEKHKVDFFIWVGCSMHKDLNCVKGGNTKMMAWWDDNGVSGPMLLANKDNAVVLDQADDEDEFTIAEQRAHDLSTGGGVKLTSLAGMVFNNKNDKIGHQDIHQQFFVSQGLNPKKFPATSNNHYQSHCAAAAELIKYLNLYIEFMEWIRDGKEKPGFTNIEKNIYNGLQDTPTQTELAVLILYAQAISYPYMRQVRGPGTENINMLDLGPLHSKVKAHLEKVISNPGILLPPNGSYELGSMDGKAWEDSTAVEAVFQLSPSLPHLWPLLVAFFEGALETWERFTSEFDEGGLINTTTEEEREKAWMPPTNDVNEGALGALRSYLRKKPNTSIHQYNALAMFKFNHTAAFVQNVFIEEDHTYVRQEARKRDGSHLEQKRNLALISHKDKQVAQRREKVQQKVQQKTQEESRLAGIRRLENEMDVTTDMTNTELKDQLEIYRSLIDGIPLKSHLKNKAAMIAALEEAITRYKSLSSSETL
jgi:hypothetical protein